LNTIWKNKDEREREGGMGRNPFEKRTIEGGHQERGKKLKEHRERSLRNVKDRIRKLAVKESIQKYRWGKWGQGTSEYRASEKRAG